MQPSINITRGLLSSDKKYEAIPIGEVEAYLSKFKDCYERTNPIESAPDQVLNRAYIDIDGDAGDLGKREFDELVQDITTALHEGIAEDVCIMESSKHQLQSEPIYDVPYTYKNKLSFRVQFLKRHGTKAAIAQYIKDSKEAIAGLLDVVGVALTDDASITPRLNLDFSVYKGNRKMRMLGSSKKYKMYAEDRPNKIVSEDHTFMDTLITYIPEDSELLPEPEEEVAEVPKKVKAATPDPVSVEPSIDGDKDVQTPLIRAIMGLSSVYFNGYSEWLNVGIICFNEGLNFSVWEQFSKQSPSYKSGVCAEKWATFKKGTLTQASIWKWLKADNPELYAELRTERSDFLTLLSCCNHAEVAKYFYNLKPDAYLYNENLSWFMLMPSCAWKHYEKAPSGLLNDIWATMKAVYTEQYEIRSAMSHDEKTPGILKAMKAFAKDIGNKHFLEGVAGMLHTFYNDDDLTKKMDESRELFAFSDKVVDLSVSPPNVRNIRPSDYICLHTGYKYPTKSDPAVRAEIRKTVMSIWENAEMADYFLRTIAINLNGNKKFQEFYVWTGKGGNGKGMITELISRTFGDYYHSIPHSCLTKTQNATDAPNPPIAYSKGKRFVQAAEPESDDSLKEGVIKGYTGGDVVSARLLHKNTICQKPQWGLFLQCNNIPKFNSVSGGILRRMKVILFPFQFVEKPVLPCDRQRNNDLPNTSDAWRNEFLLMLLDVYSTIRSDSLDAPAGVEEETKEYFAETNPVREWLMTDYDTGLDVSAKKYWLPAKELKRDFIEKNREHTTMSDAAFKNFMMNSGVPQDRKSSKFKCEILNESSNEWVVGERAAGSYYLGIRRKAE